MANAVSAAALLNTLGINTHLDFGAYGYQNLATVESNINYLGVKIIRDSAETATDAQTWLAVSQATGATFDDYVAETSPAGMATDLGFVQQLAKEGILQSVEGGNEEDDAYPASLGNTLQITAQFQQQLYALGKELGLPVINMSFGAGWTAANDWEGDYGAVGNQAAYATDANAHTYPNAGQLPDDAIQQVNTLAEMAASGQPVITTEIGWSTSVFSETAIAKYVLDAVMDGIKDGDRGMYFYGLYDDGSGNWGLFNPNGTPRPAATALHDLTTLLTDTGTNAASFTPGALNYTLSGTQSGDNSVLIEKSNGSLWLSLWNETEAANRPHTITVNLGAQAASVVEYDPLTGTSSIKTWSNVSSVQVSVPDHPVLLEIVGVAASAGTAKTVPPPVPAPASPSDLSLKLPSPQIVTAGTTRAISGISVSDAWAASNPGTMAVNVWDDAGDGTISAPGHAASGSLTISGTLAQVDAALAALSFTAESKPGSDGITVDAWNQAGVEQTQTITITIGAAPPMPTGPVITAPATESVTTGTTTTIAHVSIADAFAAANAGTMAMNLNASSGTIGIAHAVGATIAGLGTGAVSVAGTPAQINADLANLSYTASGKSGSDSVSVNVWDQAGLNSTATIEVTAKAATVTAATPVAQVINIAVGAAAPAITASDASIVATAGNHSITIGGTGDVISALGGTETVMAFLGGNATTTGAGNDTIRIAGSGNVVNAGAGANQIDDTGSGNTIVLAGVLAGQGTDAIHGFLLQGQDKLDLRALLAATNWTGSTATLGNFLHVGAPDGSDTVILVTPSGQVGGASHTVATLFDSGPVGLSILLAHSLV
jgi:serralysin